MLQNKLSFLLLTGLAGLTILLLLLWRQQHFSSIFLILSGVIVWGIAFIIIRHNALLGAKSFEKQWTFHGALIWLGMILVALGIVWLGGYLRGKTPSSQSLLQEFFGFSLAYFVGLILYRVYRMLSN